MARIFTLFALLAASLPALVAAETPGIKREKIGIYDLAAIHGIDLKPEIISKTEDNGLVFEKVRFSSVDNVRVFAILSYKKGATKLPGLLIVDRFKASPKKVEATNGYFAISIAPPNGNQDPAQDLSIGGPRYQSPFSMDDQYRDNPKQSYIYHHTVALLRTLDYLETRPEVDLSNTVVTGYSWPGLMVATLHGLDDRPKAYVLWHGLGYYADANGQSGGQPALITKEQYDMYGAGVYAPLGTKPFYAGVALDDYFTKLDSVMEVYNNLKCEKVFAYAPNRHHAWTSRQEFDGGLPSAQLYWQLGGPKPASISDGTVKADSGKLIYTAKVDSSTPLKWSEVLVSYGKPGNWMSRTWHSFPLVKKGDDYQAEIPVYDPAVPLYAIGQIYTDKDKAVGNGPQFIEPLKVGVSAATTDYPHVLFDPADKSDFYLRTGAPTWTSLGGKPAATIQPTEEKMVLINNIEPSMWKGAKELSIWLYGDGKPGVLTAYLPYDANYLVDKVVKNYTAVDLVPTGATMASGWKEYTIPIDKIANLDRVGALFLEPADHTLQLGIISWK